MQFEFLSEIVALLDDAEIPHMLAGSMAKLEWRARSDAERRFRDVVAVLAAQDPDIVYLRRWAAELGVARSLDEALAAAGKA